MLNTRRMIIGLRQVRHLWYHRRRPLRVWTPMLLAKAYIFCWRFLAPFKSVELIFSCLVVVCAGYCWCTDAVMHFQQQQCFSDLGAKDESYARVQLPSHCSSKRRFIRCETIYNANLQNGWSFDWDFATAICSFDHSEMLKCFSLTKNCNVSWLSNTKCHLYSQYQKEKNFDFVNQIIEPESHYCTEKGYVKCG